MMRTGLYTSWMKSRDGQKTLSSEEKMRLEASIEGMMARIPEARGDMSTTPRMSDVNSCAARKQVGAVPIDLPRRRIFVAGT